MKFDQIEQDIISWVLKNDFSEKIEISDLFLLSVDKISEMQKAILTGKESQAIESIGGYLINWIIMINKYNPNESLYTICAVSPFEGDIDWLPTFRKIRTVKECLLALTYDNGEIAQGLYTGKVIDKMLVVNIVTSLAVIANNFKTTLTDCLIVSWFNIKHADISKAEELLLF